MTYFLSSWMPLAASIACALAPVSAAVVKPPLSVDWRTSPLDLDLRGMNGARYRFLCPPGKPMESLLTGNGLFTDASSICSAAAQTGVIQAKSGGLVTIEIQPGRDHYVGATRNFIRSNSYAARWGGSFVIIASPGSR